MSSPGLELASALNGIKTEHPEITTGSQNALDASVMTARRSAAEPAKYHRAVRLHLVLFATAFLIVYTRRPDAVLHAQFYAEDGTFFFRDAYHFGLRSLLLTCGGYFHAVPRLTALFAQLFPLAWAPLILNLAAITVQILPLNIFLSSRFSDIAFQVRLFASFIYLALPNSFEIHANITNVQWHLALLACLLLLAHPARTRAWQLFDATTIFLTSLSSPMGILLVPVAAFVWWKRRNNWAATSFALLSPGAAIQIVSVLLHWHARQAPHSNILGQTVINGGADGASFHSFAAIMGRQVFLSTLLGLNTQNWLLHLHYVSIVETISTALGLGVFAYVLRYAPVELKLFILFASAVLALGLVNPLAGPPDHPQWYWLCLPGCGNRYYFLPMLAFLASLFWIASLKPSARAFRYFAIALLLLLPVGIYRDWRYPPFENFRFAEFAKQFERVPSGTKFIIPINPEWLMELTKH